MAQTRAHVDLKLQRIEEIYTPVRNRPAVIRGSRFIRVIFACCGGSTCRPLPIPFEYTKAERETLYYMCSKCGMRYTSIQKHVSLVLKGKALGGGYK